MASSIAQHPVKSAASTLVNGSDDPRAAQKSTFFQGLNEGPGEHAAKISGLVSGGKRQDVSFSIDSQVRAQMLILSQDAPYFTNNEGIPWPDPSHSKNVGGIPLISDPFLLQKQQTFNRSKNLERMVHPCGSGAFGHFEVTEDVSKFTKLRGQEYPLFLRFSTVTLGREFPDSARNPRGFAIKLYTGEGNYDIVGLNWPIFFCRDPIQGPDVIRSQHRNPQNFLIDNDSLFDLLGCTPEANHAGLMFFSNHGTPVGWRYEHGYGCHTFKWVNKDGKFVYIKYHFVADHGQRQFTVAEATQMCGENPDYAKQDLFEAIENEEYPTWTAKVQIMEPNEADFDKLGFDPFDITKVWPRDKFPMHTFGKLTLNKNPENYHRDVEQAAFSPGSMVPGIEDSPDPLLQFRMFFYRDAQYHRIGTNLHQIPVNCPFMSQSMASLSFDGQLRSDGNHSGNAQYVPNSFAHKFRPDVAETPYTLSDNVVSRKSHFAHEGKDSDYDQARELWSRVMDDKNRKDTITNTVLCLKNVRHPIIVQKFLSQAYKIGEGWAKGVFDGLPDKTKKGLEWKDVIEGAKGAELAYKEKKLQPQEGDRLVGFDPQNPVYQLLQK
ncbi:uncharacterized protein KY384_001741 [Bacidia gigantensis]|uniref:uncharacterized protein n=1 Tax=Bacidia gigantensis TaxID=2732470 RepID=UPI001D058A44|nr:uncharacterized protein KY384_001741 [Bacidia gigantensis]KAG8532960.1 hypothetical protein KY384_001741 [Bacidia gigantensis]